MATRTLSEEDGGGAEPSAWVVEGAEEEDEEDGGRGGRWDVFDMPAMRSTRVVGDRGESKGVGEGVSLSFRQPYG